MQNSENGNDDQDDNPNPKKLDFDDIPTDIIAPEIQTEVDKIISDNDQAKIMEIGNAVRLRVMQAETNALKGESINAKMLFEFFDFHEILKKHLQFNPVIDGWFCEGDNVLIHASGGTGKSLLTMFLAMFMASGQAFTKPGNSHPLLFDQFPIHRTRNTLFIQSENTRTALYQRVYSMCEGDSRFKAGLENIFIPEIDGDVCLSGMSFSDGVFTDWLGHVIDTIEATRGKRIDVVVIDPFISYFGGKNENDNGEMRNVLDQITKFARKARVTPILVHHDGKDGLFRGASAIHDWARSRIHLTLDKSKDGGPCVKITHEKNNNGPRFDPLYLRFDDHLIFRVVDSSGAPTDKQQKEIDTCQEVFRTLQQMGGFAKNQDEISKVYMDRTGLSFATSKRHVKIAREKKYIIERWEYAVENEHIFVGFELSPYEKF
ncbi:MAG: AAA family ATPase [Desulfobacteraceae bacterium]|jgi:hypothetical protein